MIIPKKAVDHPTWTTHFHPVPHGPHDPYQHRRWWKGWDPNFAQRTPWSGPHLLIRVAPWPAVWRTFPVTSFVGEVSWLKIACQCHEYLGDAPGFIEQKMVMRQAKCDLRLSPVYFNNPAFKRATEPQAVAHHPIMFLNLMGFPSKWSRSVRCTDNGSCESCALPCTFTERTALSSS